MKVHRGARLAAMTLVVIALAVVTASSAARSVGNSDTCVVCTEVWCESGFHDAWDDNWVPEQWYRNGGAHLSEPLCREYSCDTRHGPYPCSIEGAPTAEELAELDMEPGDDRLSAVAERLMAHHPTLVVFKESRSALQVIGCQGNVIRHVSLTERQARALAGVAQR